MRLISSKSVLACWLAAAVFCGARESRAADASYARAQGFALGFNLHRFQDDFGVGLTAATPFFAGDHLRLTLGGGVAFYPYGVSHREQAWENYGHVRLVFEGGARAPGSPVRLYSFGGPILYLLGDGLSTKAVAVGGLGGFGFEYYFMTEKRDGPVSYHMELGGIGTNAQADKLAGKPRFGGGFLINVGMRWYL